MFDSPLKKCRPYPVRKPAASPAHFSLGARPWRRRLAMAGSRPYREAGLEPAATLRSPLPHGGSRLCCEVLVVARQVPVRVRGRRARADLREERARLAVHPVVLAARRTVLAVAREPLHVARVLTEDSLERLASVLAVALVEHERRGVVAVPAATAGVTVRATPALTDRKSTRLNSSH